MPAPDQEYRSLMLRKAQLLAQQHGGISNIPREKQRELGFDIIAGRKGSISVSVRIPEVDLSSRIAELKSELPKITFESAKPDPEKIFGKYVPQVSLENPTMDDFWIMQGWYKEDRGGIKLTRAKWQDDDKVCVEAVRFLVEKVLKKDPRDLTAEDFNSNGLSGLMSKRLGGSPYGGLVEAGYAYSTEEALQHAKEGSFQNDKIYPWEMVKTPRDFYYSEDNRIAAIKWFVAKLQKDPRDLTQEEFNSNRLGGLLAGHYNGSPIAAFTQAGYAYSMEEAVGHAQGGAFRTEKFYPWEMSKTSEACYDSKEKRVAAVKWLIAKLHKGPRDIESGDFDSNRLCGLLNGHYQGSPYAALVESGYVYTAEEALQHSREGVFKTGKFYPWEMAKTPMNFYTTKENRIAATRWIVSKLQKDPRDIFVEDFYSNCLTGLIDHYKCGPYKALLEAGYLYSTEEALQHAKEGVFRTGKIYPWEMARTQANFYESEENRIAATKWLAAKLQKSPRDVTAREFYSQHLSGLMDYYGGSPYAAFLEAGLVTELDEAYVRGRGNPRFSE